jgi:hypothetical protein
MNDHPNGHKMVKNLDGPVCRPGKGSYGEDEPCDQYIGSPSELSSRIKRRAVRRIAPERMVKVSCGLRSPGSAPPLV